MRNTVWILAFLFLSASAFSQGKYGSTAEDSVECVTNISLYKEHYKQKNYPDAKIGWINVFDGCPQSQKSTYINGVKMYRSFIKKEQDAAVKKGLIDTLYLIYDRRIEYYKQKAYVLGRKGSDMATYSPDDLMPAYETLKESVYLGKAKSEAGVLAKYYQVIYQLYANKAIDKSVLIEEFLPVTEFLDAAIFDNNANLFDSKTEKDKKKYTNRVEQYSSAKATIDDIFIKVALCADIEPLIEARVNENPNDLKTLRVASYLLSKRECTDSEVFATVSKKLYEIDPSARSAYGLGLLMSKRKKYSESAKYLKQAVELCDDCPDKEKYLLKTAKAVYFEKNYKSAAKYAKKAIALNPNSGDAYLTVGMAIASSANSCGATGIQKSAIFWLAIDYFYKAKSVDPSVSEQANKHIATYKKYYASKEEVFFANLKVGDSFTVECWGENTKVKINE